jgi:hypothetical protein
MPLRLVLGDKVYDKVNDERGGSCGGCDALGTPDCDKLLNHGSHLVKCECNYVWKEVS